MIVLFARVATANETQMATKTEATTTQATTTESSLENSIQDPESGVVLVNVSHIYSGHGKRSILQWTW